MNYLNKLFLGEKNWQAFNHVPGILMSSIMRTTQVLDTTDFDILSGKERRR